MHCQGNVLNFEFEPVVVHVQYIYILYKTYVVHPTLKYAVALGSYIKKYVTEGLHEILKINFTVRKRL